MASLMENLIEVLCQESDEYEGLLDLSQKKTQIIASADLEELQRITDDEQELVDRLNRLEKKRVEVTKDIANVLNRDVEKMKLSKLIEMLAERPKEQAWHMPMIGCGVRFRGCSGQTNRIGSCWRKLWGWWNSR